MATLLLAAAGSALGGAMGGSIAGLGSMVLGKAAGAVIGSAIDQRLLGQGSAPVETGRVERFRVMGSSEGAPIARVFGRNRVAGQVIWSSRFLESVNSERVGGKGGGASVRQYSYSVSLAIALCEGEVSRVGRIWADGQAIDQSGVTCRLHPGTEDQLADPLIAAIEGDAPAYRGTAYVVFENLDLTPYGNRIPQFNFEVFRRRSSGLPGVRACAGPRRAGRGPGAGLRASTCLQLSRCTFRRGKGNNPVLNIHNDQGIPDLRASLAQLSAELPNARSVSLVVSWFGDDLRCSRCMLQPAVEQAEDDGDPMRWKVSGQGRDTARVVSRVEGRPLFGGTPADASVLQAIAQMRESGLSVMFYPFILMDIVNGNGLADPWSEAVDQPPVPWRGRITLDRAPGRGGSSDKTSVAATEVSGFFGSAVPADFHASGQTVVYDGPAEWSYRRFVLHYAHLCAMSGGVEAFCIGSELRGLTQVRDSADGYPVVRELVRLAEDVRTIVGPSTKIGYAADWSEYFGHHPADGSGDVFYHLDPLWSSPAIDFVGIDNYMPLSDWRDGKSHADAAAGSIYDLDYLTGNVAGGEGFDWYYADAAGRDAQDRLAISDGAYGEDWVFRYKDLVSWWSKPHVNRPGGVKMASATEWQPKSKPIWFTELGCPAVEKGTNQPNVFHDPKSSESFFPHYSNGSRDDFIQYRYLQATYAHWSEPGNNPESDRYAGRMVDMSRAHVWAWDARPWPDFPARLETWVDGENYECGHWLNGRASLMSLAEVVAQICDRCGVDALDLSKLHGGVTGYLIDGLESGRQSLQPLMLAYAFDSFSIGGALHFANRPGVMVGEFQADRCVLPANGSVVSLTRAPAAETADRVTLGYVRGEFDYQLGAAEARAPEAIEPRTEQSSLAIVFLQGEAEAIAARSLSEGRVARDSLACALPPSTLAVTVGDLITIRSGNNVGSFRIDRVEEAGQRGITAVRVEPSIYDAPVVKPRGVRASGLVAPSSVDVEFLDLPLLEGDEDPLAPHLAVARTPWSGPVAVYSASDDFGYSFDAEIRRPAVLGSLLDPLPRAEAGHWMPFAVRVRVASGNLQSRSRGEVLNGANVAALRAAPSNDWEVVQFCAAELVAPRVYRLDGFLRGQAGTDGVMPDVWPVGTDFVLLDGAVGQVPVPANARGLDRHYRIGPMNRSYDNQSYIHRVEAFAGVGLRPYRPCHLTARRLPDGDVAVSWARRTRIDGDSWVGAEVPLGEEGEAYLFRISRLGLPVREITVGTSQYLYTAAEQESDGVEGAAVFEVAQVSVRFGPGPFERIEFDG